MADAQISQSGRLFPKIAFWMRNGLTLFDGQILMTRLLSFILPKMQECKMKIFTVPVHGFSAPKLDYRLPKLGRMCCIPEKTAKKNAWTLLQTLRSHAMTSLQDRIWGLPRSRAMCMVMYLFGSDRSSAGCQSNIQISPNFLRSHLRRYCLDENRTTNDTQSIPLF